MDLLKPLKKVVKRVKDKQETRSKLKHWQDKFENAKASYDMFNTMDEREAIYLGTHGVDKNINSKDARPSKLANNVINIVYELIESQIDTTIPQPTVRNKLKGYEYQAKVIEDSIKNDLQELSISEINDENERVTPVQGSSFIWLNWNPDYKHHLYRGELELRTFHPKQIIPQPGVYYLQKMDYFFIVLSMTKSEVKDRWGIDVDKESEDMPEANEITGTNTGSSGTNDNVTVKIAYYREQGEIGRYVWTNDTQLEDMPKFYSRRIDGQIQEFETIHQDIQIVDDEGKPINVIPALSPEVNELGIPTGNMMPTAIPYFTPTRYPVVMRENVPLVFRFGGQSDVDIIRDQQDAIKKIVSNIEEKILKGGHIITALTDHNINLTNELYQVIKGNQQQLAMLNIKDLTADTQKDMETAKFLYDFAKSTLGITDAFQGKPDPTAQSGVAKQIQINQSNGRVMSKQSNKYRAYKELFEIMFEFKLAFYDDVRPYMRMGNDNQPEYGFFNKFLFLERDSAGEWYYNTDYLFSADAGSGIPKDKLWLQNQAVALYQMQAMSPVQLWMILDNLGFPFASQIRQQIQEQMEQQQAMQQQQMMMQQQQQAQQAQMQQAQSQQQMAMQENARREDMQLKREQMNMKQQETQQNQMNGQVDSIIKNLSPEQQQAFMQLPEQEQVAVMKRMMNQ